MGDASLTNSLATHVSQTSPTTNYKSSYGLYLRTLGSQDSLAYLYFPRTFPLQATILSAKIKFYNAAAFSSATHTVTFQRLNQAFSVSTVTYNTRPTSLIAGTKTVTKTGTVAVDTEWEVDVTDWMQTISNGGVHYGMRMIINEAILRTFYSENHPTTALRPRLEISWSDAPQTPADLSPSGGRAVGLAKPVLKATYRDYSGATQLQALQVQINATDSWGAPSFDSGTVITSVPELDLNTTAYAGLADGSTTFWRIRFQDAAGVWSAWSTAVSFKRDDKGVLTVINPQYGSPALWDNFEGSAQGWVLNANATVAHSTAQAHSGTGSLAITATGTSTASGRHESAATLGVPVVAGRDYSAEAWFRAATAARNVVLSINWWTAAGVFLSNSPGVGVNNTTSDWTRFQGVFTAPPTAAFAHIIAAISNPAGAGEVHYVDDVTFTDTTTFPVIEDATPPIAWTFTGETQAAYQVQVRHVANGVQIIDWDSGKVTSTVTSVTVPSGINEPTDTIYTVTVRIWDNKQREATPGDNTYVEVIRDFTFVPGPTTGTTALTAVAGDPRPKVTLTWTAATFPDRFNILRNGKVVAAALDPVNTFVSGTTHSWVDDSPSPQRVLTYQVQRVVGNVASATNSTAVVTVRSSGIWLREPVTGLELHIATAAERNFTLGKESAALKSIAPNSNVVLINQSLGGLQVPVEGELVNIHGRTAQQWRDQYIQMRELRVKLFWLTIDDFTFRVVCDFETYGRRGIPENVFKVGFMAYQQDSITKILLGS